MIVYERDGAAIYRQSFATIRAEADLAGLPADVSQVAVRMIHACGMVDLVRDLAFSPNAVADARTALRSGAPILCDVAMVASGVTRKRLPAEYREPFDRALEWAELNSRGQVSALATELALERESLQMVRNETASPRSSAG